MALVMLQPLQAGQALLASRTVSWNPANFSQALLREGETPGNPDVCSVHSYILAICFKYRFTLHVSEGLAVLLAAPHLP